MKTVVIGNGAWGSALFSVLSQNCKDISYLHPGEKVQGGSLVVLAVPTQAIREVLNSLSTVHDLTIVNCAKGIEQKSHKFPFEIAKEVFNGHVDYFSLIGPSFSEEVKKKMPTLVNLGFAQKGKAETVKQLFQTDYFRVHLTLGVEGLELSGAFKNVYAIACGIAEGLGFGVNTRVKLILLAMEEIAGMNKKLGFTLSENAHPGTIGDLILTCNSKESRNFAFGELLVRYSKNKALEQVNGTVEGFYTVSSVPYFAKKTGLALPLANFVHSVISENNPKTVGKRFSEFVKGV